MTKIISLVFLLVVNTTLTFAQSDEVHLKDGTVVKGEIYRIRKNTVSIRVNKKGGKIKGYRNVIKAIDHHDGKVIEYKRRDIKGLPPYLSGLLISGKASLYIIYKAVPGATEKQLGQSDKTRVSALDFYYAHIENKEKAFRFLPNSLTTPFKKRTSKYFSDCRAVVAKVKSKVLQYEDLEAIVDLYNESCSDK